MRIRNHDHPLHRRQMLQHLRHGAQRIQCLAGVEVAVRREQHLRRDLPEPIHYPVHPEVGRAGGPCRPEAGSGQHRDHRLRKIRGEGGDTIARHDAGGAQPSGDPRDRFAQFFVSDDLPGVTLVAEHQRRLLVVVTKQVLGEVQCGRPEKTAHPASVRCSQ